MVTVPPFPDDPTAHRKPSSALRALLSSILKRNIGEWCNDYASEAELRKLLSRGNDLLNDQSCVGLLDEVVILSWDTRSGPGINYGGLKTDYLKMRSDLKAYWKAIRINEAVKKLNELQPDELTIVIKEVK